MCVRVRGQGQDYSNKHNEGDVENHETAAKLQTGAGTVNLRFVFYDSWRDETARSFSNESRLIQARPETHPALRAAFARPTASEPRSRGDLVCDASDVEVPS
jgi:hypothetical protein